VLFGVYVAAVMWAGLVLRYPALQATLLGASQASPAARPDAPA
jgi:hypothetical protein